MTKYENTAYWKALHEAHTGRLKAVGHPGLSESVNRLKYDSEAESAGRAFAEAARALAADGKTTVSALDIGAGTGFFSALALDVFKSEGLEAKLTALDLSETALAGIKKAIAGAETLRADLKTVDTGLLAGRFDVVFSFYCLHHLVRLSEFLRALEFACKSVAPGGFFLLMDPVLSRPYSKFDSQDFDGYAQNGACRHRFFIDDAADSLGLTRVEATPAVSYLLNGPIEAETRLGYDLASLVWRGLSRTAYRSEAFGRLAGRALAAADRRLKSADRGKSSTLLVYRKINA